jgi:hypothetical protein
MGNSCPSRRVREEAIVAAGRFQHRQVTREQLRAAGLDDDAIKYRAGIRRLHPVFAEVFSLGGPPVTDREIWMAATLTFGRGAQLAASAAVDLYGWLRYPLGGLFVLTPTPRKPREGIVPLHRANPGPSKFIDFIPVTGPEQTVLDCAMTVRSDKAYRRVVRQAQVDDTTHARLVAFAAMNAGARGVRRMRKELADGPSPTRSANEDEVLAIFRSGATPIANHRFAPDLEADLYFPALGVVIEVDSRSTTARPRRQTTSARTSATGRSG